MELSALRRRLLRVVLRGSVRESFGRTLLAPLTHVSTVPGGLAFGYKVPPSLCRVQKAQPVLSNAAALAIFDELSSDAMMVADRSHRGGISIHLTTELLRPVPVNEEVVVLTRADKIGKTLGFLSMEMRSQKGELLARGKHVKYMSMGWLTDLVVSPRLLPLSLAVYDRFLGGRFRTELDDVVTKPRAVPDAFEGMGSAFAELSLVETDVLPSERDPVAVYSLQVRPGMWNQLGLLHGGCAALAIEEACEAYLRQFRPALQRSAGRRLFVEKMDVRYLAQLQGHLEVRVRLQPATFQSNEVVMMGTVGVRDSGVVGIEFACSCTRG